MNAKLQKSERSPGGVNRCGRSRGWGGQGSGGQEPRGTLLAAGRDPRQQRERARGR